ncbi:M20/M25/M40 family metallo-hydrolase [Secundilactobacillus folii]|uniref:M20/M25/M40 family metallo-hydrolase n=1 Tax=Secundilactobacillus folii TaxID=2678357 RepID=UPI001565B5B6
MSKEDQFIDEHLIEFQNHLRKMVAFKSISATNEGIPETVSYLTELLKTLLDAKVEVHTTKGSPIIVATMGFQTAQSVLLYGHYDAMMPGDRKLWHTDPYVLTERDGRLFGRGTGDNKGQLLAQIFGLYTYKQLHGRFPFTIKLLIDGEEEQGSQNLPVIVKQLANTDLADVCCAIIVDGSINQSGDHVLRLGNRGALGFEITVQTGSKDNHSGNLGNIMENPVLKLMAVLNRLYDANTNRVKIPHFYDGILEPTAQEVQWIDQLPYDPMAFQQQTGTFTLPKEKRVFYRKLMFEPTFNISGIESGYTGDGLKTIIPHTVTIKGDCRLVADQDPQTIIREINQLLAPEIAEKSLSISYPVVTPPSKTASSDSKIPAIAAAIKAATGSALIEPSMPGTVPNYIWSDILKVPAFTIPYANFDQNNHAPNENITVSAFKDGMKISYELLKHLQIK